MPSSATVPSAKDMRCSASQRSTALGFNNLSRRELNGSPELLLDLALDAGPEFFVTLGRRPYARRGIDVEMPSATRLRPSRFGAPRGGY